LHNVLDALDGPFPEISRRHYSELFAAPAELAK
jgi:hypothetical protein